MPYGWVSKVALISKKADFTYILQGYFTGTGATQWRNPEEHK